MKQTVKKNKEKERQKKKDNVSKNERNLCNNKS